MDIGHYDMDDFLLPFVFIMTSIHSIEDKAYRHNLINTLSQSLTAAQGNCNIITVTVFNGEFISIDLKVI